MSAVSKRVAEDSTFLPSPDDPALAKVVDLMSVLKSRGLNVPTPVARLTAPDGRTVELPERVMAALLKVVEAMSAGLAVTVAPTQATLTTQQAADLLGVSRPTLVHLLETHEMPFTKPGRHRRVLLTDVLAYRERQYNRANAALDRLADLEDELALYDADVDYSEVLGRVRKQRAERRGATPGDQ